MTNIIWSQFTDLQKIDLSHKCAENLPPGVSQCEGVESVNVNSPILFISKINFWLNVGFPTINPFKG